MEEIGIIEFKDWQKLDLRVGKILKIEEIEGADKLYKLTIDLGKELGQRTLVAGLKPYYKKEQLKEKLIIVFQNLAPKNLKGIESKGMVLAATSQKEGEERKVSLIEPDSNIELGSRIS